MYANEAPVVRVLFDGKLSPEILDQESRHNVVTWNVTCNGSSSLWPLS